MDECVKKMLNLKASFVLSTPSNPGNNRLIDWEEKTCLSIFYLAIADVEGTRPEGVLVLMVQIDGMDLLQWRIKFPSSFKDGHNQCFCLSMDLEIKVP